MKITFLLPPVCLTGGIKVVANHAHYLIQQGHEVTIVAPDDPLPPLRERLKRLLKHGTTRGHAKAPSHLEKLAIRYKVLDKYRPITDADVPDADVVVATWWETAEWMMSLSACKGRKAHFVQGYEVFHESTAARVHAVHRLPVTRIVISRWLQEMLRVQDGDQCSRLVENGIDDQYFELMDARTRPAIRTVGLLLSQGVKVKGMPTALAVVRNIQARMPGVRVLSFAGHQVAEALDLPLGVSPVIDPPQSEIRSIYRECDVWLSCSTNEGFNLTVVEALATGTPVVATRVGWPAHGVINGQNGFVQDVDDVDAITRSVQQVLQASDDQWLQWSAQARRSVSHLSLLKSSAQFALELQDIAGH